MSNLTAAVIGTGFIGPIHVEGLKRAGVEVAGILGSDGKKSRAAAAQLGLPRGYQTIEDLLADATINVVHIASPNRLHFQQAAQSLAAGKHVLCEKPLAMTSKESSELVRLARDSGLAAAVNYNTRYYPLCIEAADRVASGQLGKLFHVTGGYAQDWLFRETDFNWRVMKEDGGELRAVADIGTHWLDLLQFIVGEKIESVCADLATVHPFRLRPIGGAETFGGKVSKDSTAETIRVDTDDYGSVMFRMRGGAKGVMWVSQVTAGRKNCLRFELAGSAESMAWNSESPNEIWIGQRDSANQLLTRDPALLGERAAAASSYPGGHNEGFGDTFKQIFRHFYDSIESGKYKTEPTFPTFAEGHHEIALCEAILDSDRRRGWVDVPMGESSEPKSERKKK